MNFLKSCYCRVCLGALVVVVIGVVTINGCGGGRGDEAVSSAGGEIGPTQAAMISAILAASGNTVISPGYQALAQAFADLEASAAEFCSDRTDTNLDALRTAWQDAMSAWQYLQFVNFGPIKSLQNGAPRETRIQTWPEAGTPLANQVDSILARAEPITEQFIAGQPAQTQGLPALEYLLFEGATLADFGNDPAGDRRCDYVQAASANIASVAELVEQEWDPAGGDYLTQYTNAGELSGQFASSELALEELVNSMVVLMEVMKARKLADPLAGSGNQTAAESWRSRYSIEEIIQNLEGLRAAYLSGMDDYLVNLLGDMALDSAIQDQLQQAISAAQAIAVSATPSLYEAVIDPDGRALVQTLLGHVDILTGLIKNNLSQALSVPISFNENDGD